MQNTWDTLTLDARLAAIADMVPKGSRFADIGCDHGLLSAWLVREGRIETCQLCDISEPSLAKARKLFRDAGKEALVRFCVGNGAKALCAPIDCAVIAGMGSSTIMQIIADGRALLGNARLVLQPNINEPMLRRFLAENGYKIVDESIARAGRRHYVVLSAQPGETQYTEEELVCGPVLLRRPTDAFLSYATFRIRVAKDALQDAQDGHPERAIELQQEIRIWEKAIEMSSGQIYESMIK